MNTTQQLDPRQRYTINEAVAFLRKSRAGVYADIQSGNLRVIKDGRRTYIPGTEIARLSTLAA